MSYADIYILAGYVAIEASGGPTIPFCTGRRDFTLEEAQTVFGTSVVLLHRHTISCLCLSCHPLMSVCVLGLSLWRRRVQPLQEPTAGRRPR